MKYKVIGLRRRIHAENTRKFTNIFTQKRKFKSVIFFFGSKIGGVHRENFGVKFVVQRNIYEIIVFVVFAV